MTSLLYYSYSRGLSENEIIEIDKRVAKTREAAYLFVTELPLNSKRKAKRLCLYVVFMFAISQILAPCAAVVLPLPPTSNYRLSSIEESRTSTNTRCPEIAPVIESKVDKMVLTDQQIEDLNLICYKLQKGSITIDKAILKLRAGGFYDWATLAFLIYMFSLQQGDSFQNLPLPHMDPMGWASGKYDSGNSEISGSQTSLEMEKPSAMPQQQYSGLIKSQKRQLPDPRLSSNQEVLKLVK
jgi:hypothetical protein